MKLMKKVFLMTAMIAASTMVFAQAQSVQRKSNSSNNETSVENEYLNDIDGEIITSLANSDDFDNKLVALQYISNAINEGNTSPAVIEALDHLSGEGILSESRTNGRLINNFPEIRRQACLIMAKVPTEHTKNMLISIALADNEPMVMAAAVNSLGYIGINDNDETVDAIAFANRRNQILNPTSSLALEVLTAFEKLAPSTEDKKTMLAAITSIASEPKYMSPVRQKAYKLLKDLSTQSGSTSSSDVTDAK